MSEEQCSRRCKNETLNDYRNEALQIAVDHGFTEATVGEDIALMHSELSEALEDSRMGARPTDLWYEEKVLAYTQAGEPLMIGGKHAAVVIRHDEPYPRLANGLKDFANPRKPAGIPSEIADVLIRAFHFAGKHGIDLDAAVAEKMRYNATRPYKHGKTL
jgi:hypothetical protein